MGGRVQASLVMAVCLRWPYGHMSYESEYLNMMILTLISDIKAVTAHHAALRSACV